MAKTREELNKYHREYSRKNPDKIKQYKKKHVEKYGSPYYELSAKQKEAILTYARKRRKRLRDEALKYYGGCCKCCGEQEKVFLCIDHIHGGGNQHRKEMNVRPITEWLHRNNYPEGFQVLCHNCNAAKSLGGCPHNNQPAN